MITKIDKIILAELALHPRASLQDFYKLFYQSYFGAEHALTDFDSARRYFENELSNLPNESDFIVQDISVNFPIYRVNLQVIKQGLITADELFEAFLKSTQTPVSTSKQDWPEIWLGIEKIINPLISPSQTEINEFREAASNGYTVHHSQLYRDLYKPHYRIICGEYLPAEILSELVSQ